MSLRANRFLTALGNDLEVIRPHLREIVLQPGQTLCEPGDRIRRVYFLEEGLVSKLCVFEDGSEIESALIGREGAVGASSVIGMHTAITRDVCHLRARATFVDTATFRRAAAQCPRLSLAIHRYCAWKVKYITRSGACNARHSVEQRLCRWILSCCDILEQNRLDLRQDVFAKMLGVQRTTINPILQKFQYDGLIELGRGWMLVRDRAGLEARACECYFYMRFANEDMVGWTPDSPQAIAANGHGARVAFK